VLAAHREAPPPRVAAAVGLPEALDRVLATALSKDPEQRQRSAANLMRIAQRAMGSQRYPIPLAQPSPRAAAATPPSAAASPRTERTTGRRRTVPSRRPAPPAAPARREPTRGSRRRQARRTRVGAAPRRLRARRMSATGIAAAALLALSATAGFATALSRTPASDVAGTRATPVAGAAQAVAHPEAGQQAAAVDAIARALGPLDATRTAVRQKLRGAEAPAAQASAARRLAVAYREARRALPPPVALAAAPGGTALPATLTSVEHGYRRLALAARQGNAHAYTLAARAIREREAQLDGALTRLA
jgi:serine/threonine-protein kinase